MGLRKSLQLKFHEIEDKHGRITKSIFVISHWIMLSKRFESMSNKFNNKNQLKYIWKYRNTAITEMLKTELFDIKINKSNKNRKLWLYVLYIEREGAEITLTVPYPLFNNIINIHYSELEETCVNKDSISIDGIELNYKKKKFKLGFITENIEKSKNKLIEKMSEINMV